MADKKLVTVHVTGDGHEWRVEARQGLHILSGDTFEAGQSRAEQAAQALVVFFQTTRGVSAVDPEVKTAVL